jgi:hypothetical protein
MVHPSKNKLLKEQVTCQRAEQYQQAGSGVSPPMQGAHFLKSSQEWVESLQVNTFFRLS